MHWYHYVSYFFAGAFLANFVPHYVRGMSGQRFPSPFASPPGKGESSPLINVLWGFLNLVVGLLLLQPGDFHLGVNGASVALLVGALVVSVMLARAFGDVYAQQAAHAAAGAAEPAGEGSGS